MKKHSNEFTGCDTCTNDTDGFYYKILGIVYCVNCVKGVRVDLTKRARNERRKFKEREFKAGKKIQFKRKI